MRIISQDGLSDYPYEHCVVFVNRKERTKLCIATCSDIDNDVEIGNYASEEDAMYVMKCIRYNKKKGYDYFFMPSAEDASAWRQENEKRR